MIMDTNYQMPGDATALVEYLDRSKGLHDLEGIRKPTGEEMTEEEKEKWVAWSRHQEMERMITLSPHPIAGREMSDEDLLLNARKTMHEYMTDKPDARYIYAVHRDPTDSKDIPHVQVAMAGTYDAVKMFDERREQLAAIAAAQFQDEEMVMEIKEEWEAAQSQQSVSSGGGSSGPSLLQRLERERKQREREKEREKAQRRRESDGYY